jgi:hypothetical protein
MRKLNIYDVYDLKVVKSLPWCGGATTIHKNGNSISYYTVFIKPKNLIQKIVTNYVIKSLEFTFEEEIKAA